MPPPTVNSDTIIHESIQEVITSHELAKAKFRTVYDHAMIALDDGYAVEIACKPIKSTRSVKANAAMWAALADISKQVEWHGVKLSPENWKDVISAGLRQQQAVPNIHGNGFVMLGVRTSKMSIKEMSDMIELAHAFGIEQGVKFSAPKWMDEK